MKSIGLQTELAFVALFNKKKIGTALAACNVYAGLSGAPGVDVTPPAAIFSAESPIPISSGVNIYELALRASIRTQLDEPNGEAAHRNRVGAARAILDDVTGAISAMNHPATGPDSRAVKDFTLSALDFDDEQSFSEDRTLETSLLYYVCASPVDETPS